MKSVEQFIESMVKVEFIESSNSFGHYPFQMFAEKKDGTFELSALALGGAVASCYKVFKERKESCAKRIYLSLDFPKGDDIYNDFAAIFTFENEVLDLFVIPYEPETGNTFDIIKKSSHLDLLKDQMLKFIK